MPFSLFREKRRAAGLTQQEIAQQVGLSLPTIRMLERGEGSIASARSAMASLGLIWSWPEPITEDPGEALARLRNEAGLSQRAMARAIGTSQPTIIALEKRFTGTLPRLAGYLRRAGRSDALRDPGALQRRLVPKSNAPEQDVVLTPELLAARIVGVFADRMKGDVLDPCRGDGAFFNAFPTHVTSYWCEIGEGRDFFGWSQKVDWIVTNPPYSKLRSFLVHAMALADNVVFLTSLNHLNTRARIRDIREAGFGARRVVLVPLPEGWPHSGFQFAAVHLQRGWRRGCVFRELGEGPRSSSIT
ncbi:MAG TPA: transcriptional regulator [Paracoccus sp.]|nr:transcriptional regulator [Paracoccus sp. (in: a-proteobacteria)]